LGETPGCRHRYIIICFPKNKGSADHKACTSPLRHSQRDKNQTKTDGCSKNGISAILYQKHTQEWKPIAYASRYPTPTEANYHPIEMEMLAIVWGYEKMSKYNHGLPDVTLETNGEIYQTRSGRTVQKKSPTDLIVRAKDFKRKMLYCVIFNICDLSAILHLSCITYCFLLLCTTNQTIPVITNKTTTPMETNISIIDDY